MGISCAQVGLALRGGWTVRHSISLPFFVVAMLLVHPVMNRPLPLFRMDLLKSWRIYVGIALLAVVNLIEINTPGTRGLSRA
jgi:hypothetical protein